MSTFRVEKKSNLSVVTLFLFLFCSSFSAYGRQDLRALFEKYQLQEVSISDAQALGEEGYEIAMEEPGHASCLDTQSFVRNELVVKFSEKTYHRVALLRSSDPQFDVCGALEALRGQKEVAIVEPNYIYYTASDPLELPNDPAFAYQWYLQNSGSNILKTAIIPVEGELKHRVFLVKGKAGADINAPRAWAFFSQHYKGQEQSIVAVIDTGVDYDHPDLAENIWKNSGELGKDSQGRDKRTNGEDDDRNGYVDDWQGWSFRMDVLPNTLRILAERFIPFKRALNDPRDVNGHGTLVAGIIAGVPQNNLGIVGVGRAVKIMALGVTDQRGAATLHALCSAIVYAVDNGAHMLNLSLAGPAQSLMMYMATQYAREKGVLVVAAAGNDRRNAAGYPAGYDGVLSVAASDENDNRAFFSNYGKGVDIAAPGDSILSTYYESDGKHRYEIASGTSVAAPIVTAVAATMRALNPALKEKKLTEYLLDSAKNVDYAGETEAQRLSVKRVDFYEALKLAGKNVH